MHLVSAYGLVSAYDLDASRFFLLLHRDEFYKTHITIQDRVDNHKNLLASVAMHLEGHSNCRSYAPSDTRVLHYVSTGSGCLTRA